MSKEPNRHQLSARLAYNSKTPAFLQRLQAKIAGNGPDSDEDDEFEDDGSGRPPIPKRPAIPTRPADDPGSADEDDMDDGPQIVVLKEGRHLSERDVQNEKRKAKGLPPLPEVSESTETEPATSSNQDSSKPKSPTQSLSFSTSKGGSKPNAKKRKAVGDASDDKTAGGKSSAKPTKHPKKAKKAEKKLLSFDEDA